MNQISSVEATVLLLLWTISIFCAGQQFGAWTGQRALRSSKGWANATVVFLIMTGSFTLAALYG